MAWELRILIMRYLYSCFRATAKRNPASITDTQSQARSLTGLLQCLAFIFCLIPTLAQAGAGTTVTYILSDVLGSPVAATDESGNVIWQETYKPYGEKVEQIGNSAEQANEVSFTGHLYDDRTGLVYMGARYYDPRIGRFMSPDPVGFVEGNPQTFNRYAYANNNPYRYVDPDGESGDQPFGDQDNDGTPNLEDRDYIPVLKIFIGIDLVTDSGGGLSPAAVRSLAKLLSGTKGLGKADPNKLNHVFGQEKHRLAPLLNKFGGNQEKAFRALDNAAQQALKGGKLNLKNGINTQTRVKVKGVEVDLVGGRVVNGRFQIGSASRRDIP